MKKSVVNLMSMFAFVLHIIQKVSFRDWRNIYTEEVMRSKADAKCYVRLTWRFLYSAV